MIRTVEDCVTHLRETCYSLHAIYVVRICKNYLEKMNSIGLKSLLYFSINPLSGYLHHSFHISDKQDKNDGHLDSGGIEVHVVHSPTGWVRPAMA